MSGLFRFSVSKLECMRKRQKAVDLTENRKRAPVARRQILRPPLRISQQQKATTTVTKHVDVSNNM